jgi:hypothetical protein
MPESRHMRWDKRISADLGHNLDDMDYDHCPHRLQMGNGQTNMTKTVNAKSIVSM